MGDRIITNVAKLMNFSINCRTKPDMSWRSSTCCPNKTLSVKKSTRLRKRKVLNSVFYEKSIH
eukprot:UN27886